MADTAPKEGDLRVWWIPQIPMKPFLCAVADFAQASLLLDALGDYDLFQFENRIKPDYCNMGGLEIFENGEWLEWENPETGDDFRSHMRSLETTP